MRPHDEEWWAEGDVVMAVLDGSARGILQCTYRDANNGRLVRADFVATAPSMYRALFLVRETALRFAAASGEPEQVKAFVLLAEQAEKALREADPSDPHLG